MRGGEGKYSKGGAEKGEEREVRQGKEDPMNVGWLAGLSTYLLTEFEVSSLKYTWDKYWHTELRTEPRTDRSHVSRSKTLSASRG